MNSNELLQSIVRMVNHDKACAYRLIEQMKRKNPHQSMEWCIEKVLWQLQRDRAS